MVECVPGLEQFQNALAHPAMLGVVGVAPVPTEMERNERHLEWHRINAQPEGVGN